MVLLVTAATGLPSAYSARPTVNSVWTDTAPIIDGKFPPSEWPSSPQITFRVPPYNSSYLNASIYITNDNSKLYVIVDATGDGTNDHGDENLLVFWNPWTWIEFWGRGGQICTTPNKNCPNIPEGVIGAVGYDTSPNSPIKHKIYETSVPLKLLNGTAGQSIDFCSPKKPVGSSISYDDATGRDNPWPDGLVFYVDSSNKVHTDVNTWGILILAGNPVPEFPTSTVTAFSVVMLICLILAGRKRKKVA